MMNRIIPTTCMYDGGRGRICITNYTPSLVRTKFEWSWSHDQGGLFAHIESSNVYSSQGQSFIK